MNLISNIIKVAVLIVSLFLAGALLLGGFSDGDSLADNADGSVLVKPAFAQDIIIAWDDFESGNWAGGSGWLDDWRVRGWSGFGDPEITPLGEPYEGSYHLKLNGYKYAERSVDLSGQSNLRLQFWAKVNLKGDYAECRISPDGTTWYAVKAWTHDTGYRFVDIDLSPYDMTSEFYIRFQIEDFGGSLYIDDLKVVQGAPPPAPAPVAPEITLDPASGEANITVIVSGTGFSKSKEVVIYFNNVGVATTTTNTQGNFSITFNVPELAAGIYIVDAEDEDDNIARAKFTITVPPTQPTPAPTPTPTPTPTVPPKPEQPTVEPTPVLPSPTPWWLEPQWLISIIIAGLACIVGIIRLVIVLRRGP